jgi:hypothetical protein
MVEKKSAPSLANTSFIGLLSAGGLCWLERKSQFVLGRACE